MEYIKKRNGITTIIQKGFAPHPDNYFETKAYRDPIDLVTGMITMKNYDSFTTTNKVKATNNRF